MADEENLPAQTRAEMEAGRKALARHATAVADEIAATAMRLDEVLKSEVEPVERDNSKAEPKAGFKRPTLTIASAKK